MEVYLLINFSSQIFSKLDYFKLIIVEFDDYSQKL